MNRTGLFLFIAVVILAVAAYWYYTNKMAKAPEGDAATTGEMAPVDPAAAPVDPAAAPVDPAAAPADPAAAPADPAAAPADPAAPAPAEPAPPPPAQ